jgi:hypothetical protein
VLATAVERFRSVCGTQDGRRKIEG